MGRSSAGVCGLLSGLDWERGGQVENSTEGSRVPLTLVCSTGLWAGGGVLLRDEREERREPSPVRPPPHSRPSPFNLGLEESELLDTLPKDEALCGLLSLLPVKDRSRGSGTGTNGEAMILSRVNDSPAKKTNSAALFSDQG